MKAFTTVLSFILCLCMLLPSLSVGAISVDKEVSASAINATPSVSTSAYSYNGYKTYTMKEASVLSIHANQTVGGSNCTAMQGMNVGTTYIYTAKRNSNDTYASFARTTIDTGAITFMNYYSSTSATSTSACNTAGHANDLLVVTANNVNYMLTATGVKGKSISRMKISGTNLYFTGYFDTVNTNGSSITASSVRQYKHTGGYFYLLIKNGETFYYCKIADTATGGPASSPTKVTCYKLFTIDKRNAVFAKSNSTAGTYANMETWVNQGFCYNSLEKTIYVPMFKPESSLVTNVILTFYVGDVLTDARMDFSTNKTDLVLPTKTNFYLTAGDTSSSCSGLEIESVGFRTGQGTTGDLKMYVNANAAPVASFEGVYSLNYKSGTGDFTPVADENAIIYTVKYNGNGGTDSGTNTSSGNYSMSSTRHIRGITTNLRPNYFTRSGYSFAGWYLTRSSDGKWLYFDADGTARWYTKGSQPSTAVLALYEDKRAVTQLTNVNGDTVTCYAQWKPNSTGTKSFYIEYDANGGSGTMSPTKVVYGTDTAIRTNTFTREGYVFNGWNAYRRSGDQWCYKTVNASTISDKWVTRTEDSSAYILKAYRDGCSVAGTSSVDCDIITFYAVWTKVKNGVYPTTVNKGEDFALGGTLESTGDMYTATVRLKDSAGTVLSNASANPLGKTYSLADANSALDFSSLEVGSYTLEVVAGMLNGSTPTDTVITSVAFEVVDPARLELTDTASGTGLYTLGDKYFMGFELGNNAATIKTLFKYNVTITDADGNTVTDAAVIGTGWTISCAGESRTTVLICDLNYDALISSADMLMLKSYVTGSGEMGELSLVAADANGDSVANATDSMIMASKLTE